MRSLGTNGLRLCVRRVSLPNFSALKYEIEEYASGIIFLMSKNSSYF